MIAYASHPHIPVNTVPHISLWAFIGQYDHQIEFFILVSAMIWHVLHYREEMLAVFRRK